MSKNQIIGILIIIVLAVFGYYFYNKKTNQPEPVQSSAETATSQTETASVATNESSVKTAETKNSFNVSSVTSTQSPAVVTYTEAGFSPSTITVKQGQTVTFVNQGGKKMWIGSAIHPTHEKYSGTTLSEHCPDTTLNAFDQCATGDIYSFIFKKVGTWGYHNHVSSGDRGTIIVTE